MPIRSRQLTAIATMSVLALAFAVPTASIAVPKIGGTSKVQKLAEKIDKLQKHIDTYGSVVAKTPDFWGQSRLMSHRIDVEKQLREKLDDFQVRLNATEITRDSAFLASALALQGAANSASKVSTTNTNDTNSVTNLMIANPIGSSSTSTDPNTIIRTTPGNAFGGQFVTSSTANPLRQISLEPTIELDQLKRYLDHLNQLRRINEGDDTADSPGYSLNLVRIPISVLPGRKTHFGYGAEITVTIKPHLSDELLPMAFKDLVINGLADRLAPTVLAIADRAPMFVIRRALRKYYEDLQDGLHSIRDERVLDGFEQGMIDVFYEDLGPAISNPAMKARYAPYINVDRYFRDIELAQSKHKATSPKLKAALEKHFGSSAALESAVKEYNEEQKLPPGDPKLRASVMRYADPNHAYAEDVLESALECIRAPQIRVEAGTGIQVKSKLAIPVTHHKGINGHTPYRLALDVFDNQAQPRSDAKLNEMDEMPPGQRGLNYQDVQAFIRSEAHAAYAFLGQPTAAPLWEFCGPQLAQAVREQRRRITPERKSVLEGKSAVNEEILRIRREFFVQLDTLFPESQDTTTASLAWHIIVESALLNEQLVSDMREIASTRNCNCLSRDWLQFYGPNPLPEARTAFTQYVECRWPIHVFALDPVTQDQNVGAAFSRRRELQLALAAAASNSRIGFQSLTRFMRRLEYDMETIELNRTEIGFSHGDDTFGWRFYPRVQAPRVGGTLQTAGELLTGGPNREKDLLSRKLEPGIRECVAIVVMPSFVPYVTVDTRSNWFLLTNDPHHFHRVGHRELDLRNAVDESREIVELRQLAEACFKDAHLYRDGEIYRLLRTVDQLDRQLPLQTAYVQMPYENTLGGFEMFNAGVTDLAPELHGWYGAPGLIVGAPSSDSQVTSAKVSRLWEAASQAVADHASAAASGVIDAPTLNALKSKADNAVNAANAAQALANNAGLSPAGKTSVFLVGKNFSVLRNTVIVGGAVIPVQDTEVISRQVMRITVPWALNTVEVRGRRFVDVHLATPYGATSHLHIPVANDLPVPRESVLEEQHRPPPPAEPRPAMGQSGQPHFSWAKDGRRHACIIFNEQGEFQNVSFSRLDDLKLVDQSELPDVDGFRPQQAQSAWFVKLHYEGGQPEFLKVGSSKMALGPIQHTVVDGEINVAEQLPELQEKLQEKLRTLRSTAKLKHVHLLGYLKFVDQSATDRLGTGSDSIVRLEPLVYDIVMMKQNTVNDADFSKTEPFRD